MSADLTESAFHKLVHDTLTDLEDQILEIDADLEAVPTPGVLTVELPDGGPFVLSQQTPTRELWLSANFRASHYARVGAQWEDTKSGEELYTALNRLLSERLGQAAGVERP